MIRFLHEEISHLIAFRLFGTVSAEDIDQVAERLEKSFDSDPFVNLYVEIDKDLSESFGGILEQAKKGFTVILPNLGKIRKVALISDKPWLRKITDFKDMSFAVDIRAFSEQENEDALAWVTSGFEIQ